MSVDLVWSRLGQNLIGINQGDAFSVVSISGDGLRMAVGAYLEDSVNGENSGVTRVYEWNSETSLWEQLGDNINGLAANDESGSSISLSGDGNYIAIGAPKAEDGGVTTTNRGNTIVYYWNGSSWIQVSTPIWGEAGGDFSGTSVSLSYDGTIVAIGGPFNRPGTVLQGLKGSTRIYQLNETQTTWTKLGSDIDGEVAGERSGFCVSLSNNGFRIAIGAYLNNENGTDAGSVRIFEWNGTTWNKLGDSILGENAGDECGYNLALSGNGNRVVVGSPKYDSSIQDVGQTRVFEWNELSWVQVGTNINGNVLDEECGTSVAISEDGNRIVVGCPKNNNNDKIMNGKVIVYDWNILSSTWEPYSNSLFGLTSASVEGFFLALSKDGLRLVTSSPGYDLQRGLVNIFGLESLLTSSTDTTQTLNSNSQIGTSNRDGYFNSIKSSLDLEKTVLVLSSAFGETFTDNTYTQLIYSSVTTVASPNPDYGLYVVLDTNGSEITFQLENNKTLRIYRNTNIEYFIYKDGETEPYLTQVPGDSGSYEGLDWKLGSVFANYIPSGVICFGPDEIVETDQGVYPISKIPEGETSIRNHKIERISKTRCQEDKMVLIRKNALGENKPNKDTLVSLNHKIMHQNKYIHAQFLKKMDGVEIINSYNRILYNVQLSKYTHMKVNNLTVETLHPNRFLK